jgi:hypothetical protein
MQTHAAVLSLTCFETASAAVQSLNIVEAERNMPHKEINIIFSNKVSSSRPSSQDYIYIYCEYSIKMKIITHEVVPILISKP